MAGPVAIGAGGSGGGDVAGGADRVANESAGATAVDVDGLAGIGDRGPTVATAGMVGYAARSFSIAASSGV